MLRRQQDGSTDLPGPWAPPSRLVVEVDDDSDCHGGHPSTYVSITRFGSYTVPTFLRSLPTTGLRGMATSGGLDGKVSCARVFRFA